MTTGSALRVLMLEDDSNDAELIQELLEIEHFVFEVTDRADNVPGLQLAIEKWLDPARRVSASEKCIRLARAYTMERNVEETLAVLEKLRG